MLVPLNARNRYPFLYSYSSTKSDDLKIDWMNLAHERNADLLLAERGYSAELFLEISNGIS